MIDSNYKPSINLKLRENEKRKTLLCNLLKLRINPSFKNIYVYSIIYPDDVAADNTILQTAIIKSIYRSLKEKFVTFITAGANLFSPSDFAKQELVFTSAMRDSKEYRIQFIKSDAKIDLENLSVSDKFSTQIKHFIEILIKNIISANSLMRMGKGTYFDRNSFHELNSGNISKVFNKFLETLLYSGYSLGVNLTEKGIFLKVSIRNKVINQKTCLHKILELNSNKEIEQYFTGASVLANYGNYKYYRIENVSFTDNVENVTLLDKKKNQMITLLTYYMQTYQVKITDRKQPLFVCMVKGKKEGEKERIFLVPELLLMSGIDEEMKANENFKKELMNKTKMTPTQRLSKINEIKNFIYKKGLNRKRMNKKTSQEYNLQDPEEIRQDWGLELGKNIQVGARILTKPEVMVTDGSKV